VAGLALLTGFPGFIGRRLVARLLADDPKLRVVALVEQRMLDQARAAASELDGGDRVEVLEGDIAVRGLGLSEEDYERLSSGITSAFHLAAIYNLAVPLEIAQRVNVDGTGNVLELCAAAKRLERLNYVSTAYVAGLRTGVVYEHELVMGQDFKNHYESTKFQAEVWVREEMGRVPTTVYRPAIVVGDSRSGETQKFDGPYYMLRSIALAAQRGMPIAQFGRSEAPFNCVPVDFIVDAIAVGSTDPDLAGKTLHLVDPDPITSREVLDILSREYAGKGPAYRIPPRMVESALRMPAVREAFRGAPHEAIRYLNHPVRFDTRNATDFLGRHGLRCPGIREYAPAMVGFFREHENDDAYVPA
jgi:thioester reductase-like protein